MICLCHSKVQILLLVIHMMVLICLRSTAYRKRLLRLLSSIMGQHYLNIFIIKKRNKINRQKKKHFDILVQSHKQGKIGRASCREREKRQEVAVGGKEER